jgi:hypothetical protein
MLDVMLSVMALAEPAHAQRLRIIIVVSFDVATGAAGLAGLSDKFALCDGAARENMGSAASVAKGRGASPTAVSFIEDEACAGTIGPADRSSLEILAAAFAGLDRHMLSNRRAP